jgi:translation elongation factor EF-Ts
MLKESVIRTLHKETGVHMNECQKALKACLGHKDLAIRWLRDYGRAVYFVKRKRYLVDDHEDEAKRRGKYLKNYES